MGIREDVQKPHPGAKVTLFTLDCSEIGGGVYPFTSNVGENRALRFNGIEYIPVAITATGFEMNGSNGGSFPTPVLAMGSQRYAVIAANLRLQDLVGARLIRVRTFAHYLDDGMTPDPSQFFMPDVFIVSRRSKLTRTRIEWELKAVVDVENVTIPRRKVNRDYCPWIYRRWDSAKQQWEYSGECPYNGVAKFDLAGSPVTDPAKDQCAKTLTACRQRFGATTLPFGGFVGAR